MQQILKLAAATGKLRQYRRDATVSEELSRHVAWHKLARQLLGLPAAKLPLPDYVSALNAWDRRVVLALLGRIERVARQNCIDVLGRQLTLSEHILYGVFVDEVLGPSANTFVTSSSLCHSYWHTNPSDEASASTFLRSLSADDVTILIQPKSGTALEIRRAAFDRFMASARK